VGVPAQLRRTSRGASLWVRGAGELLPASALVAEHHSSPRGSAATGWLCRCCEGIPGCAQADGMGSFSGQHLDLDMTRGAPRFHDAVRALVGAAQEAAGVRTRSSTVRTSIRSLSHEEREICTCSCGTLWPVTFTGGWSCERRPPGAG
jgi:hypothetical protein